MGGCFSSVGTSASNNWPTAKVVTVNGSLSEYPVPVTVSQVLEAEEGTASSSSSFICNSDRLYYDDYIPALDSEDELEANQIYFMLARSKLERRLTATDMAALAVRATLALQNQIASASASASTSNLRTNFEKKKNPHRHRRNSSNKARISPVLINFENSGSDDDDVIHLSGYTIGPYKRQQREKASAGLGLSRSGSVKKLQRYTSKRAKLAVRSFRLRLSTIHEGSVL